MNIIKKWNNISLVKRIITGLAAGIILGLAVPQAELIGILGDPVSYTHLDVYKRQTRKSALIVQGMCRKRIRICL